MKGAVNRVEPKLIGDTGVPLSGITRGGLGGDDDICSEAVSHTAVIPKGKHISRPVVAKVAFVEALDQAISYKTYGNFAGPAPVAGGECFTNEAAYPVRVDGYSALQVLYDYGSHGGCLPGS